MITNRPRPHERSVDPNPVADIHGVGSFRETLERERDEQTRHRRDATRVRHRREHRIDDCRANLALHLALEHEGKRSANCLRQEDFRIARDCFADRVGRCAVAGPQSPDRDDRLGPRVIRFEGEHACRRLHSSRRLAGA